MAVLACLAAHAGEILPKDQLIAAVWPDVFVGDDVLTRCICELRRVFGDSRKQPRFIETVQKRGYRLIAAVVQDEHTTQPQPNHARIATGQSRVFAYSVAVAVIALSATASLTWLVLGRSRRIPSSPLPLSAATRSEVGAVKPSPVNSEAYSAYLRGRHYLHKRTADGVARSVELFQHAIDIEPTYANAYAGLADAYAAMAHYRVTRPEESYTHAQAAAKMALELDATLAEPHDTLGQLAFDYEHDWSRAEAEYQKALQLDSNYAMAHHHYGMYLGWAGRFEEALAEERRAHELDPLSPVTNNGLAMPYYFARKYDKVIATCASVLKTDPNFWIAHIILGYAYEAQGNLNLAVPQYRKAVELSGGDPDTLGALGHAYAVAHNRRAAKTMIDQLTKASGERYVPRFDVAIIYVGLGDTSSAFRLFEQGYAEHNSDLPYYFRFDPRLDRLRSDERFKSLARRLNLPDSSS